MRLRFSVCSWTLPGVSLFIYRTRHHCIYLSLSSPPPVSLLQNVSPVAPQSLSPRPPHPQLLRRDRGGGGGGGWPRSGGSVPSHQAMEPAGQHRSRTLDGSAWPGSGQTMESPALGTSASLETSATAVERSYGPCGAQLQWAQAEQRAVASSSSCGPAGNTKLPSYCSINININILSTSI